MCLRYVTDRDSQTSLNYMCALRGKFSLGRHVDKTELVVGLQVSIRECGDVSVVDVWGRSTIGGGESELFSKHLRDLVAKSTRKLLLNLENLTQVDSSGVGIIVETYVSLKRFGGELKLLCPSGRVLTVLTVFRLPEAIPTFENETQALASFQGA
jgi:anti-sigma B factor antagonist